MILKMDKWTNFWGYLITGMIISGLIAIAYLVEIPVIKLVVGMFFAIGSGVGLGVTVSESKRKIPFLSAGLFFAALGIAVELYRFDTFPRTEKSNFYYMLAMGCLMIGVIGKTYEEIKKRKGGPPASDS